MDGILVSYHTFVEPAFSQEVGSRAKDLGLYNVFSLLKRQ